MVIAKLDAPSHRMTSMPEVSLIAWPLATGENYAGLILNVLDRMGLA